MSVNFRKLARIGVDSKAWRPANGEFLLHNLFDLERNDRAGYTDRDHLLAAARWLASAQDASGDGGVAGRYVLGRGWTSSYPETTGYIIPTLLRLASHTGDEQWRDRAGQCVDFLCRVQLETGAFPGMEIAENRTTPSVFNTAQILSGLRAWHATTGDEQVLERARRACDWLVAQQDSDGAWRKHLYGSETYTYMAHAGCWIAEMGEYLGERDYLESARAHLEWVLTQFQPETAWFDRCGFSIAKHHRGAVTHTIAYTIWGTLMMSRILGHAEGLAAARRAALQAARRLELSRWLPGELDSNWRGKSTYTCPTGNAQMALVWLELHRLRADPALVSTACKAIDLVKRVQPMDSTEQGICGGVPGSAPVWGGYVYMSLPNWAAKFFIDSLIEKQAALATLRPPSSIDPLHAGDLPTTVPVPAEHQVRSPQRVVLLASPDSHKVEQMVAAWSSWGFEPSCVIVSREPDPPAWARFWKRFRRNGIHPFLSRLRGRPNAASRIGSVPVYVPRGEPVPTYCRRRGIRFVEVGSLSSPESVAAVHREGADLLVYAGAGILRKPILDLPRLGTVNAHMGILPQFRGMNVAEWSRWFGAPTGCSVHLVDQGIDTGDILCIREVPNTAAKSISELRRAIDAAQIDLLGEVVRHVVASGELPRRRVQLPSEGRQYFAMHPEVRLTLERWLHES